MGTTSRTEAQKHKILSAALKLFIDKGYKNTTTREIADLACINKGLLHYYYKSKEDIFFDIYKDVIEGLIDFLEDKYNHEVKGFDFFALLNMLYYKITTSDPKFIKNMLDILSIPKLSKYKIAKSMKFCLDALMENTSAQTNESDLLIAITISIGAESQLLFAIEDGTIDMTYREMAATVHRLVLTILKVDKTTIDAIIDTALEKSDAMDIRLVLGYIGQRCPWIETPAV